MKVILILVTLFSTIQFGHAGCAINLTVRNTSDIPALLTNKNSGGDTAIKSKGGSWRGLRHGGWLDNFPAQFVVDEGRSITDIYKATFRCSAKRRYRFQYTCLNNKKTGIKYYPSASGWTQSQNVTVDIGELCVPEEKYYSKPKVDNKRLDWCLEWGTNCGAAAADYFCELQGQQFATNFEKDIDIGPTYLPRVNQVCNHAACDGFKSITCQH